MNELRGEETSAIDSRSAPPLLLVGMFLVSMAVLALQVTVTRIFSFTIWYHYAFFVIALALLGVGR